MNDQNSVIILILALVLVLAYFFLPLIAIPQIEWVLSVLFLAPCLLPVFWVLAESLNLMRLKRALQNPDKEIRLRAVNTLQTMRIHKFTGVVNIPALKLLLKGYDDEHEQIRHIAVRALHHKINMQVKVNDTSKSSPVVSVKKQLDSILTLRIATACIQRLKDPFPPVREEATSMLRSLGNVTMAFPFLLENLTDADSKVREESARTLSLAKNPQSRLPLIAALKDDVPSVRLQATRALGYLKDKRTQDALLERLRDEDELVRAEAAEALKYVGESRAFNPLARLLKDPNPEVRKEAANTLRIICASLHTVMFGRSTAQNMPLDKVLHNPDVSMLTSSMPALQQILVHTETYDFHQVERFLTYAVNYIGQGSLKKRVKADLYGEPEKLHPNLRNTLTNLCERVSLHPEENHPAV